MSATKDKPPTHNMRSSEVIPQRKDKGMFMFGHVVLGNNESIEREELLGFGKLEVKLPIANLVSPRTGLADAQLATYEKLDEEMEQLAEQAKTHLRPKTAS